MHFDLNKLWSEYTVVAFDTETSGAYPVEAEIIELGATKWSGGKVVGQFQTLLRPSRPLESENIRIHGITNEMVKDAPLMSNRILEFCEFIDNSVLLAHHAPFDLGFLTPEIEKAGLSLPCCVHLCTSLLSRALLHTTNHKLQTLVKELKLEGGAAHRASDDAYACLQVFFKCTDKLGSEATLKKLLDIQNKKITWSNYQLLDKRDQKINQLFYFAERKKHISIKYDGGSSRGVFRPIQVLGIVRNPDGDYVSAICGQDQQRKRFYVDKIAEMKELI